MLRGQRAPTLSGQQKRIGMLKAYSIHDLRGNVDRVPPEGIAFVDTTDPNGQRNLALLRRGPESVDLLLDNGQQLEVQYRSASEVRAITVEDLQLQEVVTLDQARIAARYPRLLARFDDTLVLITNDLRNHNLVDDRGLLRYKIAWQVGVKALDLKQLVEGDPGRYQVWLDVVPDRDAGPFGAPIAWIIPTEGSSLPWYRVIWYWEHVPGWRKEDWFPYATRYNMP
jgi:hypothetical protein